MNPDIPQQPYGDDAFDQVINGGYHAPGPYQPGPQATANPEPGPYGPNPHTHPYPPKTGLTGRGRAALAVGGTVLAAGSLLGWQHYQAAQAANEVKAKELAIEQQKLDLDKLQALGKANEARAKQQSAADKSRQKLIDACVAENKGLVGKQLGATYRSVLEDCQAQYPDSSAAGADMQEAGSASSTNSSGGGAGTGLLVGGTVLAMGLGIALKRLAKGKQAPAQPYIVYPGQYPNR